MGSVRIDRLDQLVLTVADIDATVEFYARVLGMQAVMFGAGHTALAFGRSKINLHRAGHEFEPKAHRPTPGSADLCLIAAGPLDQVFTELTAHGVPTEEGPVERTGATGLIRSVYFRDPDGNLIEVTVTPGQRCPDRGSQLPATRLITSRYSTFQFSQEERLRAWRRAPGANSTVLSRAAI